MSRQAKPSSHGETYWHPLVNLNPPAWACAWGEDPWGVFATFLVGDVEQEMRWIPAGTFWMGSPPGEAGRDANEDRHLVTLTKGFWMAQTPCTQDLWLEVMGQNPSRFVSGRRPVETVSWEDCQGFLERLSERCPGLEPRLPTEAQWEHACRAGVDSATWPGDLKILGVRDAPLLDPIAWYGGNSGEGFDLEKGWDSSSWPEKQYSHKKTGTRLVALKEPNPWGLLDILGNVYEWCSDWKGPYPAEHVEDPKGPDSGSLRVFRGGSWNSNAQDVRAACRDGHGPGVRGSYLGFRLVRGPGSAAQER